MLLVFALALLVYLQTLAPTISWAHHGADGGDLITAAVTRGVPHPTGYPTYTLLGRLFLMIPWGDAARRLNLMSAFCGALAVGLLYLIVLSTLRLYRGSHVGLVQRLSAAAAALALAFSPLFWSQSLIAEVYTLNACLAGLVVYLVLRWIEERKVWLLGAAAFVHGLGMGNHVTIALLLPALVILVWPRREDLPLTVEGAAAVVLPFLLGLSVYAYLPIAAADHPPVNWGDPSTWRGFRWLVSGRLYRRYFLGLPLQDVPYRLSAWSGLIVRQFGWWGFLIGLAGCWAVWERSTALGLFSTFLVLGYSAYAMGYDTSDSQVNLIPALLLMALWLGWGLVLVVEAAVRLLGRNERWVRVLGVVLVLLVPALSVWGNFRSMDVSDAGEARAYGTDVLEGLEPNALLLSATDRHTFTVWYFRYAERIRTDVAVLDTQLLQFDWYRSNARHVHPEVAMPSGSSVLMNSPPGVSPELASLIDLNRESRPVYFTDPTQEIEKGFHLSEEGAVYRLVGSGKGESTADPAP
jgi:hypothetical protein